MTMPFDKTRQQRCPLQFHHHCSCRHFKRTHSSHSLNDATMHKHLPSLMHNLPIKYPVRMQQIYPLNDRSHDARTGTRMGICSLTHTSHIQQTTKSEKKMSHVGSLERNLRKYQ